MDAAERAGRNEATFRRVNEAIEATRGDAGPDAPVAFLCECGSRRCALEVYLTLREYEAVRAHGRRFAIRPDHDIPSVEAVVETHPGFAVVEKHGEAGPIAEATDPRSQDGGEPDDVIVRGPISAHARRVLRAYDERRIDALVALVPGDVEWRPFGVGEHVLRGHEQLRAWLRAERSAQRRESFTPHSVQELDGCVMLSGSLRRYAAGGFVDQQTHWALSYEDGRLASAEAFAGAQDARRSAERRRATREPQARNVPDR